MWTGPPDMDLDGDGEFDAVRLDLDGDGVFDDAIGDGDDDGLGDFAALDIDDDGNPEARFTDDGAGSWTVSGAAARVLRWFSLDGVEHDGPGDIDGDGVADRLLDIDHDGLADRVLVDGGDGTFPTGYVDTDGDGRWDLMLTDVDGDGAADSAGLL